jgi:hypothetical protein
MPRIAPVIRPEPFIPFIASALNGAGLARKKTTSKATAGHRFGEHGSAAINPVRTVTQFQRCMSSVDFVAKISQYFSM